MRKGVRLPVEILAGAEDLCEGQDGVRPIVLNILDLSEAGIRVESPVYLKVGAIGTVRFRLPDTCVVMAPKCEVMLMSNEILMHYGIEFKNPSDDQRTAIRGYIDDQQAG